VPDQNALENHVALISAGQGVLRGNLSGVMPVEGMDTTRGIAKFVLVDERTKPQRPKVEAVLRTVNEEDTCMHF